MKIEKGSAPGPINVRSSDVPPGTVFSYRCYGDAAGTVYVLKTTDGGYMLLESNHIYPPGKFCSQDYIFANYVVYPNARVALE
jgi:hypothetical protein